MFQEALFSRDKLISQAQEKISKLNANMGKANLAGAIKHITAYRSPWKRSRNKKVFLITDGAVANVAECVHAAQSVDVEQWFGIGIGRDANTKLLSALVMPSGGSYTVVDEDADTHTLNTSQIIKSRTVGIIPHNISVTYSDATTGGVLPYDAEPLLVSAPSSLCVSRPFDIVLLV